MSNKGVGRRGEDVAADYLGQQGYQIVERNFRTRFGEIDLICWDDRDLVFVEVKARTSHRFGLPEEAITWRKRQKLRQLISLYLQEHEQRFQRLRLEAIAIDLEPVSLLVRAIRHFRDIG